MPVPAPQSGAHASVPGLPNLPPNIMALLQGQSHSQQATPPTPSSMPPNSYGMPPQTAPPPSVPGVSPMPLNGQQGYQQLMAYLVS